MTVANVIICRWFDGISTPKTHDSNVFWLSILHSPCCFIRLPLWSTLGVFCDIFCHSAPRVAKSTGFNGGSHCQGALELWWCWRAKLWGAEKRVLRRKKWVDFFRDELLKKKTRWNPAWKTLQNVWGGIFLGSLGFKNQWLFRGHFLG